MVLTLTTPMTDSVCTYLRASEQQCDRARITEAIRGALEEIPEGGWLDSHAVTDAVFAARCTKDADVSWDQTRDYVQHVLREAAHVCRRADGYFYRIHAAEVCSKYCDLPRSQRRGAAEKVTYCATCFLALPTSGLCGNCN